VNRSTCGEVAPTDPGNRRPGGEPLDVRAGAPWPVWMLSNLSPNAFTFAGLSSASMEGLLQSLKYEDPDEAAHVRSLAGRRAKRAGRKRRDAWQRSGTLWIEGRSLDRFGPRYQRFLDGAYAALFHQCHEARRALLTTDNAVLIHSIGEADPAATVLTSAEFCERLMRLRSDLRRIDHR
jgi:predicted NAD-dependent protein-ADP-ribosyltransferase YbiA (DUF1768 family)